MSYAPDSTVAYPDGSAAALYESHCKDRDPYLRRAEESAKLTLPSIMPVLGHNGTSVFHSPYQSIGARGSKNLAAKLLLAILPPNSPFFRMTVTEAVEDQIAQGKPELKTDIQDGLSKQERTIQTLIEQTTTRVTLAEGLLHFVIVGNGLFYVPEDGNTRFFPLNQYIVVRDPAGTVLHIVTKELVSRDVLTQAQRDLLEKSEEPEDDTKKEDEDGKEKSVNVYTRVCREDNKWSVTQELNGIVDPSVNASYPLDASAYIPVRFRKIDGEAYGRGYVEENIGDLRSLEGLSMSLVEAAAGLSKLLILVNPNGVTSKKTISNSPNLAVRDGKADDVTFLRSDKSPDLNWVNTQVERLTKSLEAAFLLNSSVQRNAERVTAEEVRFVAQELEDGFGAVYSILTQEYQLPLAKRFIAIATKKGAIVPLPKDTVRPQIITGLEALGRGHDLNRVNAFVAQAMQLIPQELSTYLNIPDLLKQAAVAIGIDTKLIRSQDEVDQSRQAAQNAALAQKAAGPMVNKVGDAYIQGQAQSAEQQAPTGAPAQ